MDWSSAVVYQIYPRSFQDSDGDGIGDLPGISARLDHIAALGADAVWLSPIYPSPQADFGYDVADFTGIEPAYGTLADFTALLDATHARGLKLLMDLVPCHTSIAHPWFRTRPEYYVWADEKPNNWIASFGGPAWSRDPGTGCFYLHSFFAEQPDLDWRNPDVVAAMQDVVHLWLERGADGYRLDALDRLLKDPELRDDPRAAGPPPLPLHPEHARLEHRHSRDAPDIAGALTAIRAAAGDAFLVGEVYLPSDGLAPYLDTLDAAFAFELLHAGWDPARVRAAIEGAGAGGKPAWVLSNHDFPRLPDRVGRENLRAAALLLLTLPGPVFVFQGDEIGMGNGPGGDPPQDRYGRDAFRHPMQWEPGPAAGFTTGTPWLPLVDPEARSVAAQEGDPGSLLSLYRELIALRRRLPVGGLEFRDDVAPGVLAYRRGAYEVVINFTGEALPAPEGEGEFVLATCDSPIDGATILPRAGYVRRR